MITAEHLEFQFGADADHDWAETYFFPIPLPDEHILIHIYVVVRPKLGVMSNDIYAFGSLTDSRTDLLHYDVRQHLPAPSSMSSISSSFGLTITATKAPQNFRIDYVAANGTEIHVDWNGLMEPFDIHDPRHSPNASAGIEASGAGEAYKGHYDMTGRVTGEVVIKGKTFAVDAIERMDRSWGQRTETVRPLNSINANFAPGLAFHLRASRPHNPGREWTPLQHGYVYEDGEVFGMVEGAYRANRFGLMLATLEARIVDVRGKTFHLHASPDVGGPWIAYSGNLVWNSMMKWTLGDRVGYGVVMDQDRIDTFVDEFGLWPDDLSRSGVKQR